MHFYVCEQFQFNPFEHATSQLEFRQEEVPLISRKFDTIQCEIGLLDTDDMDAAEAERNIIESNFFELRSRVQELVNVDKLHNNSGQNTSFENISIRQHIQLAPILLVFTQVQRGYSMLVIIL